MNAQELKSKITESDIIKLLGRMGSDEYIDTEEAFLFRTACHHGQKYKLYYYKESKYFHCYSECFDSFDIIELVCRNKDYSFGEAINWICIQLDIPTLTCGFGTQNGKISDWDFINNIRRKKKDLMPITKKDFYDASILNIFQRMYWQGWVDEGIDIPSMIKYGILYCTLQQKIIIPHYNIDNQLMGIRARLMLEEEVEQYGKYCPFQMRNVMYSHPLSQNLYGININKEAIKRKSKIMLVESEKSVLQCYSFFKEDNFAVALCGGSFSNFQRDLILSLEVREVIIALDKEYQEVDSIEAKKWANHIIERFVNKLAPYCIVTVLWDTEGLLPYKSSPSDINKETLLKLMDSKIYVGCTEGK